MISTVKMMKEMKAMKAVATKQNKLRVTNEYNKSLIRNDLEIHDTRNINDKNRRFGASCAIIKVT